MISAPDRQKVVELIREAVVAGAHPKRACAVLEIGLRTYRRWTQGGGLKSDGRPEAERGAPANKLTPQEQEAILAVCNEPEYQSASPAQIVPALADQGIYLAARCLLFGANTP